MLIDIISDLHEDSHSKAGYDVRKLFKKTSSEVLIIAGDTSHNPENIISLLSDIKKFYKKIFFVIGNHELYSETSSVEKLIYMKLNFNKIDPDIHFLDGDIVEYNGVKFAGSSLWYDGSFIKKYKKDLKKDLDFCKYKLGTTSLNAIYSYCMNDSRYIKDLGSLDSIFTSEKIKLESFYQNADVIITHINPICDKEHFDPKYRDDISNAFFCFNGEKYVKDTTAKIWVYGHTHSPFNRVLHGTELVCNPLGYHNENIIKKLVTKEI